MVVDINADDNGDEFSKYHFQLGISKKKTKPLLLLEHQKIDAKEGDIIHISPQAHDSITCIANHISKHGGASLIIDYGEVNIRRNTLRGIKKHKFVSVFENPGQVDLSVDVDFAVSSRVVDQLNEKIEGKLHCHGPIDQGIFLKRMGIEARVMTLLSTLKETETNVNTRKEVIGQYERLVNGEMGKVYKVQSIVDCEQTPYPFDRVE
jgi:NADH dehydrogenase [ubiquinone] 1 alpha subcomplex assembly factor 7